MLMLFVNLIIVVAAIAACVWGCFNPRIKNTRIKLPLFIIGLALNVVAVFTWAFCDIWLWINGVLIVESIGLILWVRFDKKFDGTHNYAALEPVIIAVFIAILDLVSWCAYAVWG